VERFLKRHEGRIKGIISGFDRILFKGTFRSVCYSSGLETWLATRKILQKDFAAYATTLTSKIIEKAEQFAKNQNRPYQYISSSKQSKEDVALHIAQQQNIREGLICILSCVEPCKSFRLARLSQKHKHFGMKCIDRKCLHLYFYFLDPTFGLMHVRLQTWFPFTIQICINGWEWLAREMNRRGISYEKRDNCFVHISDFARAQQLMDSFFDRRWFGVLNHFARLANPWFSAKNPLDLQPYYWTIRQCEFSTDVVFKDDASLSSVYPGLLRHAIHQFHCKDVLTFLGRRVRSDFNGEVKSQFNVRVEGTRVKHWVEENSIKMYDKQGCVLRVETTMNNPCRWKAWRRVTRKNKRTMAWIPMRKSIQDMHRRAEVSRAANSRYLDALSVVGDTIPAKRVLDRLAQPIMRNGRSYRPLHLVEPTDAALCQAITQGEFLLHGFRNRDLCPLLYPEADKDPVERRKASQRLSRRIRLLKEHGLVYKVRKSNVYRISRPGLTATAMAYKLRESNLLQEAA
jgi:hypothetical protein